MDKGAIHDCDTGPVHAAPRSGLLHAHRIEQRRHDSKIPITEEYSSGQGHQLNICVHAVAE